MTNNAFGGHCSRSHWALPPLAFRVRVFSLVNLRSSIPFSTTLSSRARSNADTLVGFNAYKRHRRKYDLPIGGYRECFKWNTVAGRHRRGADELTQ